ncbi:MAG: methanethiol S-methyltransferase [Pirellulales bacterium]
MKRWFVLLFGAAVYVMFLGVFLYAIGFIGGFMVPTSLDGPVTSPLPTAIAINSLLLLGFAAQHSIMARPAFKRWWTKFVPDSIERSIYVLFSNLAMILLFWQWRPMGGLAWDIQQPFLRAALWALFGLGWLTVLASTYLINHFDLFGLRQVWLHFRGRPYTHLPFAIPGAYKFVRHPLYVGWLLVFWATPSMGLAHLVFAIGTTVYILIAIRLEERDLVQFHGESYTAYRRATPMLIPKLRPARVGRSNSHQLTHSTRNP